MATITRGTEDSIVHQLKSALEVYEREHPGAEASLFRQNPGTVYVRIFDDRFAGLNRARRHDETWDYLSHYAGSDPMAEVLMLVLLTRAEAATSMSNMEFEDPIPYDPVATSR